MEEVLLKESYLPSQLPLLYMYTSNTLLFEDHAVILHGQIYKFTWYLSHH